MGRHYTQLSIADRCELARLYAQGCSLRQIAAALDRAPATIARELKRNSSRQQGYRPRYAQEQARWRLRDLGQGVPCLRRYTLSGVCRLLPRLRIRWKRGRLRGQRPDRAYATKRAWDDGPGH